MGEPENRRAISGRPALYKGSPKRHVGFNKKISRAFISSRVNRGVITMAKYVYPAILTPEENGQYSVIFPDIKNCYTGGDDMADALEMAEDVLCLTLYGMEKDGKKIPPPSD